MKIKDLIWRDNTSYSQGAEERVPKILETEINGFRIIIHRHKDYENMWLLSCHELRIEKKELDTDDFEAAVKKAIDILIEKLNAYVIFQNSLIELNKI